VTAFCGRSSPEWAGTLVEPQESLAALLGSSTVGVAVCDRQLRFQGINQALATMNGVPARAHIGKKLHQILGSVACRLAPAFEQVFETGKPFSNFKLAAQLPARSEIGHWIEDYYPIRSTLGKVVQVGVIVVEVPATQYISQALPHVAKNQLSCRERQVIRFLAEGKSNKEMAAVLGISIRTVETYRARMMLKLGLRSIVEVARYAVLNSII